MSNFERKSFEFRELIGRDMECRRDSKWGPEVRYWFRGPVSRVICKIDPNTGLPSEWQIRASWLAEKTDQGWKLFSEAKGDAELALLYSDKVTELREQPDGSLKFTDPLTHDPTSIITGELIIHSEGDNLRKEDLV